MDARECQQSCMSRIGAQEAMVVCCKKCDGSRLRHPFPAIDEHSLGLGQLQTESQSRRTS